MKVQISSIPKLGLQVRFNEKDAWVEAMISNSLREGVTVKNPISGSFHLIKVFHNLNLTGEIQTTFLCRCDRCLNPFELQIDLKFKRILAPLSSVSGDSANAQELKNEITQDDLNFSFYEGDEIDVSKIFSEQIILEEPFNYHCSPGCKGLCQQCGVNLNRETCQCAQPQVENSPFASLKKLFIDKK